MTTKYCIVRIFAKFGEHYVVDSGNLFDNIEDAVLKCADMNKHFMEKPYRVGKVEYEQV